MPTVEPLPDEGASMPQFEAGDVVKDPLGFRYDVAYVMPDGSFAVDSRRDGPLFALLHGQPRNRYHYKAGEMHAFVKDSA